MNLLGALVFKVFHEPLIPVAGTVDLAPFLFMLALLTLGAIFMATTHGRLRQWLRRINQLSAAAVFVVGLHPCACMVRDLIRGALRINFINVEAFLYMTLIIPLAAFTMIWGRVFCGWVCPIGFIQEITTKLTAPMRRASDRNWVRWTRFSLAACLLLGTLYVYTRVRTTNEPLLQSTGAGYLIVLAALIMLSVADRKWEAKLRAVRYVALAFLVAGTIVGIYLHAAFCVLFTNDWGRSAVMLFVGVLFASLVLSQAWCRFLCPEGALLGLLSRLSGRRINLDAARCSGCNTCNQVCPVEAIEIGRVDELSCLHCCRCADACPTGAIELTGQTPEDEPLIRLPVLPSTRG